MIQKFPWVTLVLGLVWCCSPSSGRAISLAFVPASQGVTVGNPASVDLTIAGLGDFAPPSLGTFDLDISFDPAILSVRAVVFGAFLGDPGDASETSITIDTSTAGVVNLFELSLLEANSTTCVFCLPPFLEDLQPSSFTLATLTFDTLATGTSPLTLSINTLGDAAGDPLPAVPGRGEVVVTPEPGSLLLFVSGVAGLAGLRKKRHC